MRRTVTEILEADEGKLLKNVKTGTITPSVWLRVGEEADEWTEVDASEALPPWNA